MAERVAAIGTGIIGAQPAVAHCPVLGTRETARQGRRVVLARERRPIATTLGPADLTRWGCASATPLGSAGGAGLVRLGTIRS
jgi:hypothetical protein